MTVDVFTMLLFSGKDADEVSEQAEEYLAGEWKVWNDLRFDRHSKIHYIELIYDPDEKNHRP